MTELKKEYSYAWAAWGFFVILCEVGQVESKLVWATLLGLFFLIEGVALYRVKTGDTLTEHILAFKGGGWARTPLVVGAAVWCSFKVYHLLSFTPVGGAALAVGFGIWFLLHILLDARHG